MDNIMKEVDYQTLKPSTKKFVPGTWCSAGTSEFKCKGNTSILTIRKNYCGSSLPLRQSPFIHL